MALRNVLLVITRLMSHQFYKIHLYTTVLILVAILVIMLFFTDTDIGKKYHIGGRYIGWTNNRYTSTFCL